MKTIHLLNIVMLFVIFIAAGCSSPAEKKDGPWNSADSQRSRSSQAQDELSREMSK